MSKCVRERSWSPAVSILMVGLVLVVALWVTGAAGATSSAQPLFPETTPTMLNYQGVVEVGGAPFEGTGYFKFAIVDAATGNGATNYWSNDGTGSGQPSAAVALAVSGGLFNVLLGDTGLAGMTRPVAEPVFAHDPAYLRVWFSPTGSPGTFEALEPNQRIASVAYALHAKFAENSAAGPPGPQGPPGPAGPQGPPGPTNPNADTVDGFHAAAVPEPNKLMALDSGGNLRVPAILDSNDLHYFSDPSATGRLNHIDLRGTLFDGVGTRIDVHDAIVADSYVDRQDNQYTVNPAGSSKLNNLSWTGHLQSMKVLGPYTVTSNASGWKSETMIPTSNSICFLTHVSFEDIDSASEYSMCTVGSSGGNWVLQAHALAGGDNYAQCSARCLQW